MSGLRGNPESLRRLAKSLKAMPTRVAQEVATDVAPVLTTLAVTAYSSGRTVYGDARPGGDLDLFVTGKTLAHVRFVAIGTVVRCIIGTPYAKYLVGKYRILPMGKLPVAWSETIGAAVRRRVPEALA